MRAVQREAFVTGGTGFIGRHVVERLTSEGWRVVALHRPSSDIHALRRDGVTLAAGSITDADSVARAMPEGCDAVFHVAGNTSMWRGGDAEQTRDNVDGTRNVVRAALARKARRFVLTSTASAWGEQHALPYDETATSNALASFVNYERTKYLAELEVEKGIAEGLAAVIVNPGHVVGAYDTTGWARIIRLVYTRKLPGVPPGSGSFAGAAEVARAHLAAAERGRLGERYLLGGADATYLEMIRIIGELTGREVPRRALPAWVVRALGRVSQWASYATRRAPTITPEIAAATAGTPHTFKSDKAIRELDYRAVPLREMLRDSYDWLKAEGLLS
jgi:nucleoside-diphosphate-sugar epimerase